MTLARQGGGDSWARRCAAPLACILALMGLATAAEAGKPAGFEAATALPAPLSLVWSEEEQDHFPLQELEQVDLAQPGRELGSGEPVLDANQPLTLTTHWAAWAEIGERFPLTLRVATRDQKVARDIAMEAGPSAGGASWQPGVSYESRHEIDLEALGLSLNGPLRMTVVAPSRRPSGTRERVLFGAPIVLRPTRSRADVAPEVLREAFGEEAEPVDVGFRLGPGASFTCGVPEPMRAGAVAVVSAFAYGDVPQGKPVAQITLLGEGQALATKALLSGVHTSRNDYDYAPERAEHERVRIIESVDAGYQTPRGRSFQRHRYGGVVTFETPRERVIELRFTNVSSVILDVYGLALLPSEE